jgi:hypothetical protein
MRSYQKHVILYQYCIVLLFKIGVNNFRRDTSLALVTACVGSFIWLKCVIYIKRSFLPFDLTNVTLYIESDLDPLLDEAGLFKMLLRT